MDNTKLNLKRYIFYVLSALSLTFISSLIGINLEFKGTILSGIILITTCIIFVKAKENFKIFMFYIFAIIQGIFLVPLINQESKLPIQNILGLTILIVFISMVVGYIKQDLSSWRTFLLVGLISGIVYLVASVFINLPDISFIIVILFSALTMHDFNRFKNKAKNKMTNIETLNEAMSLYLDVINIFANLTQGFSKK